MPPTSQTDESAARLIPAQPTLPGLREAALICRACDLWKTGTQTVFGQGSPGAELMFVGEQPGDREDIEGKPFVGPAGKILDDGLSAAGIDRSRVYITNAVKHFKWIARGKRRIHLKPNAAEIEACSPWLRAEIDVVRPELIVCLGGTAAQALLGSDFRVSRQRGQFFSLPGMPVITATVHPSSILRAPDDESRALEREAFIADLRKVTERFGRVVPARHGGPEEGAAH
jgi:DNA polymerase